MQSRLLAVQYETRCFLLARSLLVQAVLLRPSSVGVYAIPFLIDKYSEPRLRMQYPSLVDSGVGFSAVSNLAHSAVFLLRSPSGRTSCEKPQGPPQLVDVCDVTNLTKFGSKLPPITHIVRNRVEVEQCAISTTAPSILRRSWCWRRRSTKPG